MVIRCKREALPSEQLWSVRLTRFILLNLALLFLYPGISAGQSTLFRFDHVTEKEGMATVGTVNYIYKDSRGFMWFGTSKGLQRFDGYQLKIYNQFPKDTASTISRLVNIIYEDDRGNFWVGTNRQGLNIFDRKTEKFISYHGERGSRHGIHKAGILSIYQDKQGVLWFGTIEGGIFRHDYGSGEFTQYLIDPLSEISMKNNVWSMTEDHDGNFWVATAGGIFIFNRQDGSFDPVQPLPPPPQEYSIYQFVTTDRNGRVWISSYWGIYVFDASTGKWTHYLPDYPLSPAGPTTRYTGEILEYSAENRHEFWIVSPMGLNRFNTSTGTFTHLFHDSDDPRSLRNNSSSGIYIDGNGLLWTASGGASKLDLNQDRFYHYEIKSWPDSLQDLDANCFFQDSEGHFWIGTLDNGMYEYDPSMKFIGNYKPTPPGLHNPGNEYRNRIACIYEDLRKNLLVSTWKFSVCIFDKNTRSFTEIPFYFPEGFSEPYDVEEILEDRNGIIWFAANDGLFWCKSDKIRDAPITVVSDSVLARDKILDICEDSKGIFWVITLSHGVYYLTPESRGTLEWKRIDVSQMDHKGMKTGYPRYVYEDIHGTIWFLAIEGLYQFDEARSSITRFEGFSKVFKEQIFQFTGDSRGNLWIVCDRGLLRYDPSGAGVKAPKLYNSSDGMPFSEVCHSPLFTDSEGYIYGTSWGGSGSGFFRFHPDSLKPDNMHLPPVVITDFKVRNRPFPLDTSITEIRKIRLKHNENFFSFEFAALDYFDPAKNQYAYMMEGLDEEWNFSGNRHYANYTGVPPGNYIFRVRGSNNDGYWNEEGASVKITILNPPWKAWWADMLYALFIAGFLFAIGWYYIKRQQLHHALQIEQMQKEQLAEVDRMKSRFYANISHEFRTPLTLILGPVEKLRASIRDDDCIESLNVMQRNAHRLQRLIDQLLSLSKLEAGKVKLNAMQDDIVGFIRGYIQSFESAARQKGIELVFKPIHPEIALFFDHDKMEKILYNLLSNALKFTPEGGKVAVSVGQLGSWQLDKKKDDLEALSNCPTVQLSNLPASYTIISITDTGSGISPRHLPHIFDRFYQADDSDSRFQEGTGLGLALVKELVELHHGRVEVQSAPGEGTVFKLYLPLGRSHLKPEEIVSEEKFKPEAEGKPIRVSEEEFAGQKRQKEAPLSNEKPVILLVEDNADMRYFIRGFLERDYHLLEAPNGLQGLETSALEVPDLVISDVMMPGMDGYELCRRIKNDLKTSHIPVILLTSKVSVEDKLEGLETGADDFITKPFEPSELMVRVANLIRQRQRLTEKFRKEFEHVRKMPEDGMSIMEVKFMEKARKVVGENLSNPDFDIIEFSSLMNMSRVQLHRKLNALFKLSATEFIRTYRLNHAARLLEAGAGNVAQVAYEVGFNNLSYFSKCFQKQFGAKPSEYHSR